MLLNEIAIISGKGGTGKTSLSAAIATLRKNMVVADCDVDAANLHLVLMPENISEEVFISGYKAVIDYSKCIQCGLCISYCRFDAISYSGGKVSITETSCDGCKLCSRVCPSNAIEMIKSDQSRSFTANYRFGKMVHARLSPGEENSGKLVNVVREKARKMAKEVGADTIIIDGPPGTGCPVISSITGAKKAIVVTEPSNSAFHDMKRVMELVRNFKVEPNVVINKYDLNSELSHAIEQWCGEQEIPVIGRIPFSEEIVKAMLNCQSIVEWQPESAISHEIENIFKLVT